MAQAEDMVLLYIAWFSLQASLTRANFVVWPNTNIFSHSEQLHFWLVSEARAQTPDNADMRLTSYSIVCHAV